MTKDEAETVAALAARCAWGARSSWDLMMRYGRTVVDPGFSEQGTAYFGVPLRSGYVRQIHEAWRSNDGHDMFMYVFIGPHEELRPPLDPDSRPGSGDSE